MKLTACAAVVVAGICPVAAAAVIGASSANKATIGTDHGSRPRLTETTVTSEGDLTPKPVLMQTDWFTGTSNNAQWSWVRPQATPAARLPSTLVNAPAPGAAALVGLAGLIVSRRRHTA